MFTVIDAPKTHPAIDAFLSTWVPDANTKLWSKLSAGPGGGTGGCWYDSPLTLIESAGVEISKSVEAAFAERMRVDYVSRGILSPGVLKPDFNELAALWDHLHFGGLALLDDLHSRGYQWAAHYATRLLWSYGVNANTPWLRDGGAKDYPQLLFGDNGRHRCFGWILHALLAARRIYQRAGDAAMEALTLTTIMQRIEQVESQWPLADIGQGDGKPVSLDPHFRVFMSGIAAAALRRIVPIDTTGRAANLLEQFRAIVRGAWRGFATYAYDVRVNGDVTGEKLVVGAGSVNAWLADCLVGSSHPDDLNAWLELAASARAAGWPQKYPISMLHFFGTLE